MPGGRGGDRPIMDRGEGPRRHDESIARHPRLRCNHAVQLRDILHGVRISLSVGYAEAAALNVWVSGPPGAIEKLLGLKRIAICFVSGAIAISNSNHLPPIEGSIVVNPLVLPPGRARLATYPLPTGSRTFTNTMGMTLVACRSASVAMVLGARVTSGRRPTSSAADARSRATSLPAQRK